MGIKECVKMIEIYGKQAGDKMLRTIHSGLTKAVSMEQSMREAAIKFQEGINFNATDGWMSISFAHSEITPDFKYLLSLPSEVAIKYLNALLDRTKSEVAILKSTLEEYFELLKKEVPAIINKTVKVAGDELEAMRSLIEKLIKELKEKYPVILEKVT